MRNTSVAFRQAAYAQQTGEVFVLLLTIEHPELPAPIRLSTDNADLFEVDGEPVRGTVSNGDQYLFLPMRITWPDDSEEAVCQARIELDNILPDVFTTVKTLQQRPTVRLQVVLASDPDTVDAETGALELSDVSADMMVFSATLSRKNFFGAPYPGGVMAKYNFPGLF